MSEKQQPEIYVMAIRREAEILKQDAQREPKRMTMMQRAEGIVALCDLLEEKLQDIVR
jgi:hypothetical protein